MAFWAVPFGCLPFRAKPHPKRPADASRGFAAQIVMRGPQSCALLTLPADAAKFWSIHLEFVVVKAIRGFLPDSKHIYLP